jgi:hypothetical protein
VPNPDASDPCTARPINRVDALISASFRRPVVEAIDTARDAAGRHRVVCITFNQFAGDTDLEFFGPRMENFSQLDTLVLRGSKITDAGLIHLRGLKQLKRLILRDTLVTGKGLSELLRALPTLQCDL